MLRFITASKGLISCITDKLALGLRLGRVRLELGSGQSSIQISLNVRIRCKNGHDYEIDECARNIEILRRKLFGAIILRNRCLAGAIVLDSLYDLIGVVTSHHVTLFDPPWPKPLLNVNFMALSSTG